MLSTKPERSPPNGHLVRQAISKPVADYEYYMILHWHLQVGEELDLSPRPTESMIGNLIQ